MNSKDLERSRCDLVEAVSQHFLGKTDENNRNPSVRISSDTVRIRIKLLTSTIVDYYRFITCSLFSVLKY
jgi:hypothetical protein